MCPNPRISVIHTSIRDRRKYCAGNINGRVAVITRDMRPKHNLANVKCAWTGTGELEEKPIDRDKIKLSLRKKFYASG